jgi:hypothetical protein
MKNIKTLFFFLAINTMLFAQKQSPLTFGTRSQLVSIEKKMQRVSERMIFDTSQEIRQKSVYEYIKLLKEALKVDGSFYFNFDSIQYMSRVAPEDSTYRILTFQLTLNNRTVRHYGCIQLNKKGSRIIPLLDYSDTFPLVPQYTLSNKNWFGAVYYKILTKKVKNKNVYFLFGYDQNDVFSSRKLIDPMWIEGDTIARFGMPIFEKTTKVKDLLTDEIKTKNEMLYRYKIEFASQASVMLRYDEEKKMIMHDHVASKNPKHEDLAFTKIPEGSYEGLKWEKEHWIWVPYVSIGEKETNTPIQPVPYNEKKQLKKLPVGK